MNLKKSSLILLSAILILFYSCQDEKKSKHKKTHTNEIATIEPVEETFETDVEVTDSINETEETTEEEPEGVVLEEIQSNFLKKLIKEEIGEQKYDHLQTEKSPYSVHFPVEGDSYSVSYSIVEERDFNKDSIMDYVVDISSEGMLGGNANTNQRYVYYIMKDEIDYKEEHTVLGYAPFSYNIIDEAKFQYDKFKVKISQNFRTYSTNDVKSTSLSFVYKDGNLYEESYLTYCKMAKLQSKTIFKDLPDVSKRVRSIEWHNYTETIEETYKKGDTMVSASLGGCDNLSLSFDTEYKVAKNKMKDTKFRKETSLKFLNFLAANTQFSKAINVMKNYYAKKPIDDEYVKTVKGYEFRILIQNNEERKNKLRFLVQIDKIDNPYQTENWEITTRNKKPRVEEEY
ncbi:hypothetical protein [Flavobacterium reichenbachii]|uniref:Lipoprotein n=1 Tax=Flavobacterium reichenbachii TaxID=362418 RepID=A0A085ZLV1_9FLAO|nr:hypothetical protein [Flavobacterium reichenbachii]KFF05415.1 hypothetical protein IW19_07675 [Flavobacterium reichenbachii]OXB12342.1 hypothetical protein B0A68_19075 [Flavobacterium reichenbachii]